MLIQFLNKFNQSLAIFSFHIYKMTILKNILHSINVLRQIKCHDTTKHLKSKSLI